ncbi:MAG: PadR family transcriptional regulator [Bryobacteraceae bacterium]
MAQIPLYALGLLLRSGPQHGYQMKKVIAEQLADFTDIKLPTVYYHLERLETEGLVSSSRDQNANRPEKIVYSITRKGKYAFQQLLKETLQSGYRPTFPLDAGFYFLSCLSQAQIRSVLAMHVEKMKESLHILAEHRVERLQDVPEEAKGAASLIFSHHEQHYRAELQWATEALAMLVCAGSANCGRGKA